MLTEAAATGAECPVRTFPASPCSRPIGSSALPPILEEVVQIRFGMRSQFDRLTVAFVKQSKRALVRPGIDRRHAIEHAENAMQHGVTGLAHDVHNHRAIVTAQPPEPFRTGGKIERRAPAWRVVKRLHLPSNGAIECNLEQRIDEGSLVHQL